MNSEVQKTQGFYLLTNEALNKGLTLELKVLGGGDGRLLSGMRWSDLW
jgi:hypothetical protein